MALMTINRLVFGLVFATTLLASQVTFGFDLVGLRATSQTEADQTATIAIILRPKEGISVCGLNVEYGDGSDEYLVVRGPGTIHHVYRQPGTALVKVEGKTRFKGLGTTFGCTGNVHTANIQILPAGTTARREAELANRRAAAERERDVQRQAIERAQATYNAQAAQQAAQRAAAQTNVRTAPPTESTPKAIPEKPKAKTAMDL